MASMGMGDLSFGRVVSPLPRPTHSLRKDRGSGRCPSSRRKIPDQKAEHPILPKHLPTGFDLSGQIGTRRLEW